MSLKKHPSIIALLMASVVMPLLVPFVSAQEPSNEPTNTRATELELHASLDQAVGNIAFLPDGQLVFSHHPFFKPGVRVATYDAATGAVTPFPNQQWNTPRSENDWYLDDVLGIRNDGDGVVWILDMGTRNDITPKLVGWDAHKNELHRLLYIPAPASRETSQLNDFVIDTKRQLVVIADEGIGRGGDGSKAALVVVDLKTGKTRRLLEGRSMTKADTNSPILINGKPMSVSQDGQPSPIHVGCDGITLDAANEWLYFCPLCGTKIYRVRMDAVANESLSQDDLAAAVETYSDKVNNGGLSIDTAGNLYSTNVESRSIGFVSGDQKQYSQLAFDDRMLWPDGISFNQDGYMYVSAAQVHLGAPFNGGTDQTSKPFYIFRFKPQAPGIIGR
ncbi:L-dopachrome tautomerase-related protein [Rhodopirellula sp. P2]|uniref:L-dopachrome tautomerase-related protein n=1 Tax=Rhodopirellula sp. P2 TaxID=2127060 RepID=UPI002367D744|nr:L-dopachrome tautomerase-related protein [Rhodopirellula sp. P2]WDQ16777.1 L-dopachrome tautomerase-related protein [Rhodopirellula sp. P2]